MTRLKLMGMAPRYELCGNWLMSWLKEPEKRKYRAARRAVYVLNRTTSRIHRQ